MVLIKKFKINNQIAVNEQIKKIFDFCFLKCKLSISILKTTIDFFNGEMEHIYKEINKIREINQEIQKKKITISEIQSFFEEIQDFTFPEEETPNELKDILIKDLIEVGKNTANIYGEFSLAEDILHYSLDVSENKSIRKQIHEFLLTVQKDKENPYNNIKNIEKLIDQLSKHFFNFNFAVIGEHSKSQSYHPDVREGVTGWAVYSKVLELQYLINELINDEVIKKIGSCANNENKIYFVEEILKTLNKFGTPYAHLTNDFNKSFFGKIKTLVEDNDELLGRINERIYKIPFSTHGIINKVDKIKGKFFGRNKTKE